MSIYGTVQAFNQDNWVELFVLDATQINAGKFYFHPGTNELNNNIWWQGVEYITLPVEASGFAFDSGSFPRPKLKLANIQGLFSVIVRNYNDLIGTKVIRKRTAVRYLDAVNFAGGNALANPNEYLEDEVYFVTQKTAENKFFIEFEMGSALDLAGVYLPKRIVNANHCSFRYRGPECQYSGNYNPSEDPGVVGMGGNEYNDVVEPWASDYCGKRLSDCKKRFGENGLLPFGGFPGSNLT